MNSLYRKAAVGFIIMMLLVLLLGITGCGSTAGEATTPTEPAAMETVATEIVLAEGETVCESIIEDSMPGLTRDEPVYGEVTRGEVLAGTMNCPGVLENTRSVSIVTLIDEDGEPGGWTLFTEHIPEDGGAWLGASHAELIDGIPTFFSTFEGDGELKGQRLEMVINMETMATKYRIVQVAEP